MAKKQIKLGGIFPDKARSKVFFLTIFKITVLLVFQCVLGYFTFLAINFTSQHYTKYFDIASYFITLINVSYVIYCYKSIYLILTDRAPNYLYIVKISFIVFYICSLLSYTIVSGSYSPFFLVGIKIAQGQIG